MDTLGDGQTPWPAIKQRQGTHDTRSRVTVSFDQNRPIESDFGFDELFQTTRV